MENGLATLIQATCTKVTEIHLKVFGWEKNFISG